MRFYLLVLLFLSYAEAQFAICLSGSECISLKSCPSMLSQLKKRPRQAGSDAFRNAICGFQGKFAKVCCAKPASMTMRSGVPFSQESLLTKDCGMPVVLEDRIHDGVKAPIGSLPWMAALGYIDKINGGAITFDCAGSLINNRYVLTAAHCLDDNVTLRKKLSVIHIGDWDVSSAVDCDFNMDGTKLCSPPHIVERYEEIIKHPKYQSGRYSDDVALIRLKTAIDFGNTKAWVKPICLPPKGKSFTDMVKDMPGGTIMTAGWGITENRTQSYVLLQAEFSVTDNGMCKRIFVEQFMEKKQLCVGGSTTMDSCEGDSGGPLLMHGKYGAPNYVVGIVAYGTDPCGINPSVYTSVCEYRDWIVENLKP